MRKDAGSLVLVYLGLGLALHLLTGGALLSLSAVGTMLLWPFMVAGWIVKLALAILIVAALAAVWRARRR